MSEMKRIPGPGQGYTYGRDEHGEFGSVFQPEEDFEIPPPLDFAGDAELERLAAEAEPVPEDSDQ